MKMSLQMLLQCVLGFCVAQARVIEYPNHLSKSVKQSESQNAFRTTVNDKLNEIGSANQASGGDNKIRDFVDIPDNGNRLLSVETVLSNYVPLKARLDAGAEDSDRSILGIDEKNGRGMLHQSQSKGLSNWLGMAARSENPINKPFNAHKLKPGRVEGSEIVTYRRKRSVNRAGEYKPNRRRQQRGIRSSVADRIAHGFGKRGGNLLLPLSENETEAQRRYLDDGTMATQLDDILKTLLNVYTDYRDKDRETPYPG